MVLIRQSRLSVAPVRDDEWEVVLWTAFLRTILALLAYAEETLRVPTSKGLYCSPIAMPTQTLSSMQSACLLRASSPPSTKFKARPRRGRLSRRGSLCQCQDTSGMHPSITSVTQSGPDRATVRVSIRWGRDENRQATFRLVRTLGSSRVADVLTADDPSR